MSNESLTWMQTFTGLQFTFPPRAENVRIEDIAHALSMQCRYAGHCARFYSVAEHCVLMFDHVLEHGAQQPLLQEVLLHDAAEAYVTDLPKPLKDISPEFRAHEEEVQRVIREALDMPSEPLFGELVKQLDWQILADEQQQLLHPEAAPWNHHPLGPLDVQLEFWQPSRSKAEFLSRARAARVKGTEALSESSEDCLGSGQYVGQRYSASAHCDICHQDILAYWSGAEGLRLVRHPKQDQNDE